MTNFLELKDARCKDCYKCLRECPVKAIKIVNHQARVMEDRCILCGRCTLVCPQNAKAVHSEVDVVKRLLAGKTPVIASVAPSFVSSFGLHDFNTVKIALGKLGFSDAEETAVGARAVTEKYDELLHTGKYKNFITSACPAVNRMIQLYYPDALKYLAPVDSPMIAHAKILRARHPEAKIVFIGPCIAKKREAAESKLVNAVLTFENLRDMFKEKGIDPHEIVHLNLHRDDEGINKARYYPISRGIIKSFPAYVDGYEFVAVDGADRCREVLKHIDSLSGMFLEINACEYACVNGPCSLIEPGSAVNANAAVRQYAHTEDGEGKPHPLPEGVDLACVRPRLRPNEYIPSEKEIRDILAKTGKTKPEDELNCGACGYNTCREKAWAVANGYADIEMCVPYMRERAESMSYEIMQNSPNGIVLVDEDLHITEINGKARALWGVPDYNIIGDDLINYFDPTDFVNAQAEKKNLHRKAVYIEKTKAYVELSVTLLASHKLLLGVMKDVTDEIGSDQRLREMKKETFATTDEVIQKQMRVAQEIASLLGETTAETKIALLKLKKTLEEEESGNGREDD